MNKSPGRRTIAKLVLENADRYVADKGDVFSCNWIFRVCRDLGVDDASIRGIIDDYTQAYRPSVYVGTAWLTTARNTIPVELDGRVMRANVHAFRIRMIKAWGQSDHAAMKRLRVMIERGNIHLIKPTKGSRLSAVV